MRKTIFLDRDGVIIEDIDILNKVENIKLIAGSSEAIKILNDNGFQTIIVTNQPSVARGNMSEEEVESINNEIVKKIFQESGGKIDKIYFCPHHPNADLDEYRKICDCRKPEPGMLKRAEREFFVDSGKSFMIGDMYSDIGAGKNFGCKTILIKSENNEKIIETGTGFEIFRPDHKFDNLLEAVKFIVK